MTRIRRPLTPSTVSDDDAPSIMGGASNNDQTPKPRVSSRPLESAYQTPALWRIYHLEQLSSWQHEQRKRQFHRLVRRYVHQLVHGCQEPLCRTPTCLSYQRRVSQKPVRRMTPLSARAVATYLASSDDPEGALCPHPPALVNDLEMDGSMTERRRAFSMDENRSGSMENIEQAGHGRSLSTPGNHGKETGNTETRITAKLDDNMNNSSTRKPVPGNSRKATTRPKSSQAKGIDPKSFTQALYDTLPMRMLEWMPLKSSRWMPQYTSLRNSRLSSLQQSDSVGNGTLHSPPGTLENARAASSNTHGVTLGEDIQGPNAQEESFPEEEDGDNQDDTVIEKGSKKFSFPDPVQENENEPAIVLGGGERTCRVGRKLSVTSRTSVETQENAQFTSPPRSPPGIRNRREKHTPRLNGILPNGHYKQRRTVSWENSKQQQEDTVASTSNDSVKMRDLSGIESLVPVDRVRSLYEHFLVEGVREALQIRSTAELPGNTLYRFDMDTASRINQLLFDAINETDETRTRWIQSRELPSLNPYPSGNSLLRKVHDWLAQSIHQVFTSPTYIVGSFRLGRDIPSVPDTDLHTLRYTLRILYNGRMSSNIAKALWVGLDPLFNPPASLVQARRTKNPGARSTLSSSTIGYMADTESNYEKLHIPDTDAAHIILVNVFALAGMLPTMPLGQWIAFRQARAKGNSFPQKQKDQAWDRSGKANDLPVGDLALHAYDVLESELNLRLVYRLVCAIAERLTHFEIQKLQGMGRILSGGSRSLVVKRPHALDLVFETISHEIELEENSKQDPDVLSSMSIASVPGRLVEWLRTVLLKKWDGLPATTRGSKFGSAILVLNGLHEHRKELRLDPEVFHTPILAQVLDPMRMPTEWLELQPDNDRVHLLDYSFLFSPSDLIVYFKAINFASMSKAYESSIVMDRLIRQMRFTEHPTQNPYDALRERLAVSLRPFLVLEVSRESPLEDTMNQLYKREKRELLRPLKVRIGREINEEGIDQGGVQQELFRLIMAEVLNPDYGMFVTDERTRMSWFQPCSWEHPAKFEMIGILFSLALYNGLTLPITFPLAFYRKLLGLNVTIIDDVQDGWPELAKGLRDLEDWEDGDVADVFVRTYDFSFEAFGTVVNVDMTQVGRDDQWPPVQRNKGKGKAKVDVAITVPGLTNIEAHHIHASEESGPSSPASARHTNVFLPSSLVEGPIVTNKTRHRYVRDYIYWLCTKSIDREFSAFLRGFFVCIDRKALSIFTPESLKAAMEGSQFIDIDALERVTKYDDQGMGAGFSAERPYDKNSRAVRWFWEVVRSWDMAKKRKLLEFVTASDRVPVTGTGSIMFSIIRNAAGDEHLPTCHTCFGRLSLPDYSSKEVLKERLETAIEHVWGFGVA